MVNIPKFPLSMIISYVYGLLYCTMLMSRMNQTHLLLLVVTDNCINCYYYSSSITKLL